MVDIKNARCEKCNKQPSYDFEGQIKARFCTDHKDEGMVGIYVCNSDANRHGDYNRQ